MNLLLIALFMALIVILNPTGDAIRDKNAQHGKEIQKYIEGIRDLSFFGLILLLLPEKNDIIGYLAGYLFLRISLHNPLYNITCGLPWWYTGTTSLSDRVEKKFTKVGNEMWVLFVRIVIFIVGIVFLSGIQA